MAHPKTISRTARLIAPNVAEHEKGRKHFRTYFLDSSQHVLDFTRLSALEHVSTGFDTLLSDPLAESSQTFGEKPRHEITVLISACIKPHGKISQAETSKLARIKKALVSESVCDGVCLLNRKVIDGKNRNDQIQPRIIWNGLEARRCFHIFSPVVFLSPETSRLPAICASYRRSFSQTL